ncbi:MAG TPA: T9SS type A sorting domain-containing protein [Flavobacterium lutivivi]|nr:T9SS type A sorting domain-containing protein [Flavobacterium lutivivi]
MNTKITLLLFLFSSMLFSQNSLWVRQGKSANNERGNDIAQDNTGNVYVTGSYLNTVTFETTTITNPSNNYCVKYNSNGDLIWAINGVGESGVTYDGNSNLYLFSNFNSSLQKIDLNGNVVWNNTLFTSSTFGSVGIQDVYAVGNDVYVTGFYSGNANFGSTILLNTNETDFSWDIFIAKYNSSGVLQWAKTAGGTGLDKGYAIYASSSGDIFTTGYFRNTASFGSNSVISNGNADIYIAKYDSSGNNIWVNKTGGTGFDMAAKIISDNSGNLLLTGRFNDTVAFGSNNLTAVGTDAFISKIDENGNYIWTKQISGQGNDEEADIFHDGTNIHFISTTSGNVTIDTNVLTQKGGLDICLGTMNNNGSLVWGKIYASIANDEGSGISYYNGATYFTGSFNATATFDTLSLTSLGNWDVVTGKIENNLSSENFTSKTYKIYPNPVVDILTIDYEENADDEISLLDFTGKIVKKQALSNQQNTINVSDLEEGIYFIQFKNNKINPLKFIKLN